MSDSKKPAPVFPDPGQIPAEMREIRQWIGFNLKWNGHKWSKPPCSATTGEERDWPKSGVAFDEAVAGAARLRLGGVGFGLNGFVGIDFDRCRNPETGEVHHVVLSWLKWLPSYSEISVSRTGVHIICRGSIAKALTAKPLPDSDGATVEIYPGGSHYFTVTGNRLGDSVTINDCQAGVDKLLAHLGGASAADSGSRRPMSKSSARKVHADNLAALRNAAHGEGNSILNSCSFFAGRAFAGGTFDDTEEQLKAELLSIVTKEWAKPHDEPGARATIESGWSSGTAQPLALRAVDGIPTGPGQMNEMTERAEQALHSIGLKYFERAGGLVHTVYGRDIPAAKAYKRDEDSVVIAVASKQTVTLDLDRVAVFTSFNKKGEEVPCRVPPELPALVADRVATKPREVPFPTLDMVTGSPVLLPSGQVSQNIFSEGVLFVPRDRHRFPPIPDRPTKSEAAAAMQQFWGVFKGFPFVDPGFETDPIETASYSVALAGALSLAARPYLGIQAVPLIVVKASTPRSGKTKIAKAVCGAALGHNPTTVHFADKDEFGKHLLPLMLAGDRAILVDNVETTLQGPKLNVLLTEGVMRDRVLGESEDKPLRNFAVFFATGNNIAVGGDLAVRALRCDIDPKMESPEARSFAFDPVARAVERHPQLIAAALTALRAYVLAGSPWELERSRWGGFEAWDSLVSGCLTWLGFADPYLTRGRVAKDDPLRAANLDILRLWFEAYGPRPVTLDRIKKDGGAVYDALLEKGQWNGYHVRFVLQRLEGRICDGYRLVRLEGYSCYQVEQIGPNLDPGFENVGKKA